MTIVREPLTGLWYDDSVRYPIGYGTELVSLDNLIKRELSGGILPEYRLRIVNVLIWHQGDMGVGDGWRPTPSNTSEASKRGESFHQTQKYIDGRGWWSGADMVCRSKKPGGQHVAPPLHDLPVQGSAAAQLFGIHANVGTPGKGGFESWHAQCIEQDGWLTWVITGRRYPEYYYQFPVLYPEPLPPIPPTPNPGPVPIIPPGVEVEMEVVEDTRVYSGHSKPPTTLFAIQTGLAGKGIKAVDATITVINQAGPGYLSINGVTSFNNFNATDVASENRSFKLNADGTISLGSSVPCQIIVDVTGHGR